jgi:hypothetical protein
MDVDNNFNDTVAKIDKVSEKLGTGNVLLTIIASVDTAWPISAIPELFDWIEECSFIPNVKVVLVLEGDAEDHRRHFTASLEKLESGECA